MILQELIRNIGLYKGVIKPFFNTWKEQLLLVSFLPQEQLVLSKRLADFQNQRGNSMKSAEQKEFREADLLATLTGTRTIPNKKMILDGVLRKIEEEKHTYLATNGNVYLSMLMNDECVDNAAIEGKTKLTAENICVTMPDNVRSTRSISTTGFSIEKSYL